MRIAMGKKFQFPEIMLSINSRPDVVIWAKEIKKIILLERIVPWKAS